MKHLRLSILGLCFFMSLINGIMAQVGISKNNAIPDSSSLLDVSSTNKGILIPRMTSAQRIAINQPPVSLLVYDTDTESFWYYLATGWNNLLSEKEGWTLSGNVAGAADFIGTTNNQSLVFKANGQQAGKIDLPLSNSFWGVGSGASITSGTNNTGTGKNALSLTTAGFNNAAFGESAMYSNTTGYSNTAIGRGSLYSNTNGSSNTAGGLDALYYNSSGYYNSAFGTEALRSNITGNLNTAVGRVALLLNTTGSSNSAMGESALYSNTTGSSNIAHGVRALYSNTTGNANVALGIDALYSNINRSRTVAIGDSALFNNGVGATQPFQAIFNTAIGSKALYSNTRGYENTAVGFQALSSNITGARNAAFGYQAHYLNTSGQFNTAIGSEALLNSSSGGVNTGVGYRALYNNNGNDNIAIGAEALFSNKANSRSTAIGNNAMEYADDRTTGIETFNTAVGFEALRGSTTAANNTGQNNTVIGDQSLYTNTSGSKNTATGKNTLLSNTSGSENTAIGFEALRNSNGSKNTAHGAQALITNTTGTNNTALGSLADVTTGSLTNATAIGYNAKVGANNSLVLGGTGADAVKVGIGTQTPDATLEVIGQVKITGGSPGTNKILTSDATGLASWMPPPPAPATYYPGVRICCDTWMAKNLDVTTYRNGDPIPQVQDATAWAALTTGAWCYYDNNPANGAIYGKLYNWYAVNDPRGLAPEGWQIPSNLAHHMILQCFYESPYYFDEETAGVHLKESGTTHWLPPNVAYNETQFTALPGGYRDEFGTFADIQGFGYWWTSYSDPTNVAGYMYLSYNSHLFNPNFGNKHLGFSIRCVKD